MIYSQEPVTDKIFVITKSKELIENAKPLLQKNNIVIESISTNSNEGLEEFKNIKSRIVLLDVDWNIPKMHGYELINNLIAIRPFIKIVGMTFTFDEQVCDKLDLLGAYGYLLKSNFDRELIPCIRAVIFGHKYFPSERKS